MWKLHFNSILEEHEIFSFSGKRKKSSSLVHRQASQRKKPPMEGGKKGQGLKYVGGVQVGENYVTAERAYLEGVVNLEDSQRSCGLR